MEIKYIYLFRSRDGYYKIGISGNVESRLSAIRTSNPDHVEIVIARKVREAFELEQKLHKRYAHRISRKSGEWFRLNSDEVIDICLEINQVEGEKPKIENQIVEKILQKFLANQEEIKDNLTFLKKQLSRVRTPEWQIPRDEPSKMYSLPKAEASKKRDDQLIKDATDIVLKEGRASASLLQRKLSIGYARAARIIDKLEELEIVGPQNGASSRIVMYSPDKQLSQKEVVFQKTYD